MAKSDLRPATLAIHAGYEADPSTGARAVPVYQTASFTYDTAQELADIFDNRAPGHIYTRISNPTTHALERRLAELEGGVGCIATSSGMAAITSVMMGLLKAGDQIIAARGIFGGTVSLFQNTLSRFGVSTVLVDAGDTQAFADAVRDSTRLIFVETIGNPRMDVPDIAGLADVARGAGIPLIVDSTVTSPVVFKPGEHGAAIVIHSTTKFINGHGTAIGGAIIDTGQYDWGKSPFDDVRQLAKRAGQFALLAHLRNLIYRDLGGCPAPWNSFLMLQGLQTLAPRMETHCANAATLATFLEAHADVAWVKYPGLASSAYRERVEAQFGGRGGSLLSFGMGTREAAFALIDAVKLAKNMTNLGDAKTLVIHPGSTIFHEFSEEERLALGVPDDMVRVSVGIEDYADIENDFGQAICSSKERV